MIEDTEIKTITWKDLSDEAKGVIEWVVNPFTDKKETIRIKVGGIFYKKCPKRFYNPVDDVNILITQELYQEILSYIKSTEDIEYGIALDGSLIFKLKDGVEI